MRWEDERESSNVEDVRGDSGGGGGGFGFGGGGGGGLGLILGLLPLLGRGGLGGIAVLVVIGLLVFGGNFLGGGGGQAPAQRAPSGYQGPAASPGGAAGADPQATDLSFVKRVAAFTEDTWGAVFQGMGRSYRPARFKIYRGSYQTACGLGQTAMGPFYCPGDQTVYLDLSFFDELSSRFGAPGRFAEAYVVAHEVGHHVQHLLGTLGDDGARTAHAGETRNETSVRTELQADCYAGVWAAQTNRLRQAQGKGFLDPGDLEQGLTAASAVGDDTLQRQARGRVVPDSFTHGSSEERQRWLRRGYDSGEVRACDTFSPAYDAL